ncbi:MAG: branched-chain amino acid transporter permease [Blastococcus sp.]|nr:branched-chain amino acid transporter permease [Blastococcus sp.]
MTVNETNQHTAEAREPARTPEPPTQAPSPRPGLTVRDALRAERRNDRWVAAAWAVMMLAGFAMPYVLAAYPLQLAVQGTTMGLLAMSIGWLMRQTGRMSFGHAAFYGITAYATANLANHTGLSPLAAVGLGVLMGAGAAVVVALLTVRTPGISFAMLTLAIGMLIWVWAGQTPSVSGGFNGLNVTFEGDFLGRPAAKLINPVNAWPLAWIALMAGMALLWCLSRSRFGRRLTAIRENKERTTFSGHRTYPALVLAFVLSGLMAALAGAVSVLTTSFVSTDSLYWSTSGMALIVAVIGGIGSVMGPPAGAMAFIALQASLSASSHYQVVLGAVLIIVVVIAPGGAAELVKRTARTGARYLGADRHA